MVGILSGVASARPLRLGFVRVGNFTKLKRYELFAGSLLGAALSGEADSPPLGRDCDRQLNFRRGLCLWRIGEYFMM